MVMVIVMVMMVMVIVGCSEERVDWVCQARQSTPMHSFLHDEDDQLMMASINYKQMLNKLGVSFKW